MSEEEILNWRYEEQKYIEEKIEEYRKNLNVFALMFMTKKQNQKNIDYITTEAKLKYREKKLNTIINGVKQERRRIDEVVYKANEELNTILKSTLNDISIDKPFIEIKTSNYNEFRVYDSPMEIKTIELKPYKINFIQQKLESE